MTIVHHPLGLNCATLLLLSYSFISSSLGFSFKEFLGYVIFNSINQRRPPLNIVSSLGKSFAITRDGKIVIAIDQLWA
ncbi:MAG: hypothetical protein BYD32DRAFT_142397 [Podila humilis]|nr:MAG: hypothetical protein BYD32DRAFT_142397 [Podila humilis]